MQHISPNETCLLEQRLTGPVVDLRDATTTPLNFTKSINLALSLRGITAIKGADENGKLLDSILQDTIPMYGRMVHGRSEKGFFEDGQAYDIHGQALHAADRSSLNTALLNKLESMPNVRLFFDHKLTGADFRRKKAWLERRNHADSPSEPGRRATEIEVDFDLMIGADGAHSAARFHMMKFTRMSYMQEYIDTLWCEFHIAPGQSDLWKSGKDGFKISPNHLHIWPAGTFMFIAIPSADKSFTCTLFMSASEFEKIDKTPGSLMPFFEENFPGVAGGLIPKDELQKQYRENPHLPLISIKCNPHHYSSSCVIVGDAAHAMVPFYGQGMNAGLEDVSVLFQVLDKHASSNDAGRLEALEEYTAIRMPDAHAINELSMGNYAEMRSDVVSPLYLIRKSIEEKLNAYLPSLGFATQYSRVSFSTDRYSEVIKATQRQSKFLSAALGVFSAVATGSIIAWRLYRR